MLENTKQLKLLPLPKAVQRCVIAELRTGKPARNSFLVSCQLAGCFREMENEENRERDERKESYDATEECDF